MEKREEFRDKRVKRKLFPVSMFLVAFVIFGLFTTVQMHIIGNAIDAQRVPLHNQLAIFAVWLLAAVVFTLWTRHQITRCYQKPVEEFSEAARRVASGDFSVYLSPHHTADKSTHLDVLFTDFNKMVEELGSIETLKTDFFSNVSHEIKTPLAVIQNNAELLRLPNLTEERRQEYTENILHATKRLSNLIMNMLKLNKLEKQAIRPAPKQYDLCAQLCECALQFEDVWEKKGLEFEVDIEERRNIEADPGLMELVWTNLLSNAVKFTPAGGTITLMERCDETGITVTVSDTGCGMSDEVKRHIFDKFYQGDVSHSTEGNGLGLALVKRILELSDGHIFVESQAGKGSSFTIRLPEPQKRNEDGFIPEIEE